MRPLLRRLGCRQVRRDIPGVAASRGGPPQRAVEGGGEWPPSGHCQGPDRRGRVGYEDGPGPSPEMKDANLDWESITAMIQDGERGKIVEVE
jgi:hypothetical protein